MTIKVAAFLFASLQAIIFIALTLFISVAFLRIASAGAGFNSPFESIQKRRLVATLAPYFVLLISTIISLSFYNRALYGTSIWSSFALITLVSIVSRLYLFVVPDPIMDNYGPRQAPQPGFLVLPAASAPPGFTEVRHHYTKRDCSIDFVKNMGDQCARLSITQSEGCVFSHGNSEPIMNFLHAGVVGHVYAHGNESTSNRCLSLIWLNPPKQRLSIYLTQPSNDLTPEFLVELLKKMK
jgi:hypothetical protein